jgi:DNA-binding beta-propeller fold protein YncE
MRKLALLTVLVGLAAAAGTSVTAVRGEGREAIPGASGTVWAVERFDGGINTLAAFDASTGEVLGVVTIGRRPIGVTAPHGTGKVYTADERSNQLTVVSKRDFSIVTQIAMGRFPHHLMATRGGDRIYVGEYGTNKVGVVDTTTDTLVAEWETSANSLAKTHAVWITNNGKDLYATNEGSTQAAMGTLSKLNADTGERIWEIPVGSRPSEVLVTPNGNTAYVTVRNDNLVKVFDIRGDLPVQVGETVIGVQPDTMQLTNDGTTLVVGLRSLPQMALMDTDTLEVRHVLFPGFSISGHEWLSANGKYTFIAVENGNTALPGAIAVVNNRTGEVVATWTYPGGPWPHGVFYEPEVLR